MKIGDLVKCERAYGAKGIIINIRKKQGNVTNGMVVYDVYLFDVKSDKNIYTFMEDQLEVINESW